MGGIKITLLDGVGVRDGSGASIDLPGKKASALLAILALDPGRAWSRDSLVGLLWSDRADSQARASLRQVLAGLRKAFDGLDPTPLHSDGDLLSLDGDAAEVDAVAFQQAVACGTRESLLGAADLYRRELLSGLIVRDPAFEEWRDAERARLHTLALDGFTKLAGVQAQAGELEGAIETARRLVAFDPLREEGHRELMRLLAQTGDRAGALKQYESCLALLVKELGVEPDDNTQALHQAIKDGEALPVSVAAPSAPPVSPRGSEAPAAGALRAIAVLPFKGMSGDAASESFLDGFTEEVILGLSRFRYQPIIASQSVFGYKGKTVNVQDAARELGAGFVIEGVVREEGDRLKVSAQLVAAEDGYQLWSQRYERPADDLFAARDAVVTQIAAELGTLDMGQLARAMLTRAGRRSVEVRSAEDYLLLALSHQNRFTREENEKSKELIERALEIEPDYAMAIGNHGWNFLNDWMFGWGDDAEESRRLAIELSSRAHALEPADADILWTRGAITLNAEYDHDFAQSLFTRALELNPNSADILADWGGVLAYLGRADEGIEPVRRALVLNPVHPDWYDECLGIVCFSLGDDAGAVEALKRLADAGPYSLVFLAAAYARSGRSAEARNAVARLRGDYPEFTLEDWLSRQPYRHEADREVLRAALRGVWEEASEPDEGEAPASAPATEPATRKTSIAVLPFRNQTGDPGRDDEIDGLAADVIDGLSRFRHQTVASRDDVSSYEDKTATVQQVADDLGVQFVLEGAVRTVGDRVRVTVQLIDAGESRQLWSEFYEYVSSDQAGALGNVAAQIVGEVGTLDIGRISRALLEKARRKSPAECDAHDYLLLALEVQSRATRETIARSVCQTAFNIDPRSACKIDPPERQPGRRHGRRRLRSGS